MKKITVYCGSSSRLCPSYYELARKTGELIASRGFGVVTGGGCMGMMQAVQDGCLSRGGHATGVIPQFMIENHWNATNLSELIVVSDMHERKRTMASISHGCIALPGGVGTWDELCEMLCWKQLGLFAGNVVIANIGGYYSGIVSQMDRAESDGFFSSGHRRLWYVAETIEEAVEKACGAHEIIEVSKRF